MTKVLIKHKDNWADEIDLEGFSIMDSEAWNKKKEEISKIAKSFTVYVGTNEEIDYNNGNEFLKTLTVNEISDSEFEFLKKNFGVEFGHCPIASVYEGCDGDEDDSDCGFFIDSNGRQVYWYSGMELDIVDGPYKGKFAIVVGDNMHDDTETAAPEMCIFVYGIPASKVYDDPDDDRSGGDYVMIQSNLIKSRESTKPSRWEQSTRSESFGDFEKRVSEMLSYE